MNLPLHGALYLDEDHIADLAARQEHEFGASKRCFCALEPTEEDIERNECFVCGMPLR